MKKLILVITFLLFCSTAHAALILRGQGTSVHGTYNLIYDDDLDITWYDFTKNKDDWVPQMSWALALTVNFGANVYDDWRLPIAPGGDCACCWGFNCTNNEMGHLYYIELNNLASDPNVKTAPFENLRLYQEGYWSGTEQSGRPEWAFRFIFESGRWQAYDKFIDAYAMAVRDGDVTFTEPNISISPTSYDFGSIIISNTSTPQTFTISNTGNADLILGTISLTGTNAIEFGFQNDICSAQIIAPSGTCTIDVIFSPTSEGAKSANLSIPSDDPDTSILNVPLSGTGIDPSAVDDDGDGYTEYEGDCNDGDDTIYPGACDIKRDSIDQDCDGKDRTKGKPCSDSGGDGGGKKEKEVICDDGLDNDGDGLIDCADRDCRKACRG